MGAGGELGVVHGRAATPPGGMGHIPAAIAFRAGYSTHTGSMAPPKQQGTLSKYVGATEIHIQINSQG